ncbi:MAG: beta-galactosidase, partial [Demequina sp.]|uniref:beta-galactosidase n=1 Tax=Demequina sp. TaxID=2050685 RepID=UPI003A848DC3
HAAMGPHAGADTETFRTVTAMGAALQRLSPVVGERVTARAVLLYDWPSWWAASEPGRPTARLDTVEELARWHGALWRRGIATDVAAPGADLSAYDLILVPHSYVLTPDAAAGLEAAVARGATLVVGPYSGVADDRGHILQGRSPVLLRDTLGVSGEEWCALPEGDTRVEVTPQGGAVLGTGDDGRVGDDRGAGAGDATDAATILGERLRADGAEVLATFGEGVLAGLPALTRHIPATVEGAASAPGTTGAAWYLGAVMSDGLLDRVIGRAAIEAGVTSPLADGAAPPNDVEAIRRGSILFLLHHGEGEARIGLSSPHHDLLTGTRFEDEAVLRAGDVLALIEGDHA